MKINSKLNIGTVYGDYEIVEINEKSRYICRCRICGHLKVFEKSKLLNTSPSHNYINCREEYIETEYMNRTFEDMKVIGQTHKGERKTRKVYLIVECQACHQKREVWLRDFDSKIGLQHGYCCSRNLDADSAFYSKYSSMYNRCTHSSATGYENYGGKGVECRFRDFVDFYDYMYDSYQEHCKLYGKENTTLERIDVYGHYEKGNVTWATWEEQRLNKRSNQKK